MRASWGLWRGTAAAAACISLPPASSCNAPADATSHHANPSACPAWSSSGASAEALIYFLFPCLTCYCVSRSQARPVWPKQPVPLQPDRRAPPPVARHAHMILCAGRGRCARDGAEVQWHRGSYDSTVSACDRDRGGRRASLQYKPANAHTHPPEEAACRHNLFRSGRAMRSGSTPTANARACKGVHGQASAGRALEQQSSFASSSH